MDNSVNLQWKSFSVPVDRLDTALKNLIGPAYDGMVCYPDSFDVVYKTEPTQDQIDALNNYWNSVTADQFSPTLRERIQASINAASVFGRSLILDVACENVELGITQANMTRQVANYCANVQRYLESGSLYAAVAELDDLIAAGAPPELSPFITLDRLNAVKNKINSFLGAT